MDSAGARIDEVASQPLLPAGIFSERFEISAQIGHGGMSVVYSAREIVLDRKVAIKVLNRTFSSDPDSLQRFRNEARACCALKHPSIVQILSFGTTKDNQAYIVMELLEGKTLEKELQDEGLVSVEKFREIFFPVMDALVYAHGKNIVHRDLKPGNLMIVREAGASGPLTVKILDFGIAKVLQNEALEDKKATVGLLGSPLYMSPEQCSGGKIDQRSDIYSLACLMYESIVGKPPFGGLTPLETMYAHLNASVPTHVEISGSLNIPRALFEVIIDALAKDPGERVASMSEFQDRIAYALNRAEKMKRRQGIKLWRSWQMPVYFLMTALFITVPVLFAFQMKSLPQIVLTVKTTRDYSGSVEDMSCLQQMRSLRGAGNYTQALQKGLEGLKIALKVKKDHPSWLFDIHVELARVYLGLKQPDKAEKEYKDAVDVFSVPTARTRIGVVGEYARWLDSQGRKEEALSLFKKEMLSCEHFVAGEPDPELTLFYLSYASVLYNQGKYQEGKTCLQKALRNIDRLSGRRNDIDAVEVAFAFYKCCKMLGKPEEGLAVLKQTSAQLQEAQDPDLFVYNRFARLAVSAGLDLEAVPFCKLIVKNAGRESTSRVRALVLESEAALVRIEKRK